MIDQFPNADEIESWELDSDPLDQEAREVLRLWWYDPEPEEAAAMTSFAFEGDEAGVEVRPVLAPYALGDIVGRNRVPRQWRQGSGAISAPAARIGMKAAVRAREVLRALRHR